MRTPWRANARVIALPMPEAAPVTMARLPFSSLASLPGIAAFVILFTLGTNVIDHEKAYSLFDYVGNT
jgi:hypothetical protein